MKLGSGFNASKPTTGDFVRHPTAPQLATEIRGIKSRLLEFFGVVFDVESGQLKDGVIPPSALTPYHSTTSSGSEYYTRYTIDRKGFFVGGSFDLLLNSPRAFRAYFSEAGSAVDTENGPVRDAAPPVQDIPSGIRWDSTSVVPNGLLYHFIVPDLITRILTTLIAKGTTTNSSRSRSFGLPVVPGERLEIFVGGTNGVSYVSASDRQRYMTSEGLNLAVYPGAGFNETPTLGLVRSPYRPFGSGTSFGAVLLEWYA